MNDVVVRLDDSTLREAERLARKEGWSLEEFVQQSLMRALYPSPEQAFRDAFAYADLRAEVPYDQTRHLSREEANNRGAARAEARAQGLLDESRYP